MSKGKAIDFHLEFIQNEELSFPYIAILNES
jgi:hypothetical protein